VQIKPIAEVAAKDEFLGIKEVTRDDMLSAHRTPPQLLGIVPKNGTGFGNVIDAARSFYHLEIVPIQERLAEVNDPWASRPSPSRSRTISRPCLPAWRQAPRNKFCPARRGGEALTPIT
jgi:hypothetical protein